MPHDRMTATSAVRPGFGVALPEIFPSGRVGLVGSEDNLATWEAKAFWDAADVSRARQSALERVCAAVASGELRSWEQVTDYFLPPDDPNDAQFEGDDIDLYAPAMVPEWGQQADSDNEHEDGPAQDDGDESDNDSIADNNGASAESAVAAPDVHRELVVVPTESVVTDAREAEPASEACVLAARLAEYDQAIQYATQQLHDDILAKHARARKQAYLRVARHMDFDRVAAAPADMQKQKDELEKVRRQIREEDARQAAQRQERLAAERIRKETAAAQAAEAKMRRELYMSLDRPWDPKDFCQGSSRLTAATENNIREALERCRLRAPPLPPDLDAMWTLFLDRYPAQLRAEHADAMGKAFFLPRS